MNARDRHAVLLALAVAAGAALWWTRRAAPEPAGTVQGYSPAALFPSFDFGAAFAPVVESVAVVADELRGAVEYVGEAVNVTTLATWEPKGKAAPYLHLVYSAESRYGLPVNLLARLIEKESDWNPNAVNRASGAQGLAQFMPATAAEWNVSPFDPASSIDGAGRYLQWLYGRLGNWRQVLAAYNWGIGNVQRRGMAMMPAETRDYVASIAGDVGLA